MIPLLTFISAFLPTFFFFLFPPPPPSALHLRPILFPFLSGLSCSVRPGIPARKRQSVNNLAETQFMQADSDVSAFESDDDMMNGALPYNEKRKMYRRELKNKIEHLIAVVDQLPSSAKRSKMGLDSDHKKLLIYIAALKKLRRRFKRATTEQAGKDEFRFDITKVVSDMHVILAAGWQDYEHISIASGGFSPVKSLDAVPSSPSGLPASASSALRTTRSMKGKMQNAA